MKGRVLWGGFMCVALYYLGGWASSAWGEFSTANAMKKMGGACRAFMEGGELEKEYRFNCADEIVSQRESTRAFAGARYGVAHSILFLLFDATKGEQIPAAHLRLAVRAQWGGACEHDLEPPERGEGFDPIPGDVRIRACMEEMYHLRPRAWKAIVERHWRLANREDWKPDLYPTVEQARRALAVEQWWSNLWSRVWTWGGVAALSGSVWFVFGEQIANRVADLKEYAESRRQTAPPRAESTWYESTQEQRRDQRREARQEERQEQRQEQQKANTREQRAREEPRKTPFVPIIWGDADWHFRIAFERLFNPATGRYRSEAIRLRVYRHFSVALSQTNAQSHSSLRRLLLATFHPDRSSQFVFSEAELTDISQHISQHFTKVA